MEKLEEKLHTMNLMMESERRKRLYRYCDWSLTSELLLNGVFNLDDWCILQKGVRLVCFIFIHEEVCNGQYDCTCSTPYSERRIKIYFLSPLFTKMVSVLHSQLYFSMNIHGSLSVKLSLPIELYTVDEAENDQFMKVGINKDEMDKENSIEFKKVRDEFGSHVCKYLRDAFNEPTSLPPFLLDSEGPTMRLSELLLWLKSE